MRETQPGQAGRIKLLLRRGRRPVNFAFSRPHYSPTHSGDYFVFCVFQRLAASFRACNRGNIAIMFGIATMPVMLAIGGAVDYSFANQVKARLDAAADAASLAAVSQTAMAGTTNSAKSLATSLFNGQADLVKRVTVDSVTVSVTESNNVRTAVVTYTAKMTTAFMGLAGKPLLEIGGTATAASSTPTYIDFYLLLDNTPSMGAGATTNDINTMVKNTSDQCAFACHDLSDSNNYYNLAKKLGVAMRIDVLRTATQKLMDSAQQYQSVASQFQAAIYTFGSSATKTGLTAIQSLTSNLSNAKKAASAIDLMSIPYQNYQGDTQTNFIPVLTDLNSAIGTPGSGSSSASRQKIVFFVSDGVADRVTGSTSCTRSTTNSTDPQTGTTYNRCQEPMNPALCTTMKTRGIKIAVLYTTYLPLPTNAWYNTWISPFQSQIATNMQNCASPGLFFEVSPSQGISEAMIALFDKTMSQARLTQ